MPLREDLPIISLGRLHPRILSVDRTRKLLRVNFGNYDEELGFCAKHKIESLHGGVSGSPEVAYAFLRCFERLETSDRDRFEGLVVAAVKTGHQPADFFLRHVRRFGRKLRPLTFKNLLCHLLSSSRIYSAYFLQNQDEFMGLPGYEEARQVSESRG